MTILLRLTKVIYVFLLMFGLLIGWIMWISTAPTPPSKWDIYVGKGYTQSDQIFYTIITLIIYNIILEIVRRTFLYIFFGKDFITLKSKDIAQ